MQQFKICVEVMLADSEFNRKNDDYHVRIFQRYSDEWFFFCHYMVINEKIWISSSSGTYIPFNDYINDPFIINKITPEEIFNFHHAVLEAMKWKEYWAPLYNDFQYCYIYI